MAVSGKDLGPLESFLEEIGERYINLIDDETGLGVAPAYCSYLNSVGYEGCTVLIDGGNSFNPYHVTRYSRLFSVDEGRVLDRICLSRAFTCHQLSALLGDRLESVVRKSGSRVVIVSDPTSLYMERAAEEDVLEEFLAAHRRLLEITYSQRLTTLLVGSHPLPRFLDGGELEDVRRRRAARCMDRILSQMSDSTYRLEEGSGGLLVSRLKHPCLPKGPAAFIPNRRSETTLDEVLRSANLGDPPIPGAHRPPLAIPKPALLGRP